MFPFGTVGSKRSAIGDLDLGALEVVISVPITHNWGLLLGPEVFRIRQGGGQVEDGGFVAMIPRDIASELYASSATTRLKAL